jgi:hypothetical protein
MIVAKSMVDAWLRTAKAGETIVYARATYLIPNVVTRRMFDLAQSGQVLLFRERRMHGQGEENFRYIARRTAKPMPNMDGARAVTVGRPLEAVKPQDRRFGSCTALSREIAPQLRSMIAEGVPMSAPAMARTLGVYSVEPVRRALREIGRMAA